MKISKVSKERKSTLASKIKEQHATWIVYFNRSIWLQNSDNSSMDGTIMEIYTEKKIYAFSFTYKDSSQTYSCQEETMSRQSHWRKVSNGRIQWVSNSMISKSFVEFYSMLFSKVMRLQENSAQLSMICIREYWFLT